VLLSQPDLVGVAQVNSSSELPSDTPVQTADITAPAVVTPETVRLALLDVTLKLDKVSEARYFSFNVKVKISILPTCRGLIKTATIMTPEKL
jgi:hypothetical protein